MFAVFHSALKASIIELMHLIPDGDDFWMFSAPLLMAQTIKSLEGANATAET